MNPETLTLFREVAKRSSGEREEYYARNQISDALRGEVESLLQAGERTVDSFAGHLASAAVRALLEEPRSTEPSGPAANVPRPVLQPEVIGRYRIIRLLGRGGMADVFLARDPMLEREIAIKLIAGGLDDAVAQRRFIREASAAGRLRHPNIVTIFDAGEFEGRPFIAMEYVAGDTLRSLIQRRAPMTLGRRLELIEHACAGLAHAHRAGVVHLDIKPDNMIVDEGGVLKVLDFGIARILSSDALATRHVVGTLRYMSPEQIAGDPIDHRSDIFSLGCSLYELLTYLPAYGGSTREIVYRIAVGPVPRLRDVMADVDPRIDDVLGRAMALDPQERYADLEAFQAALARLRSELDPRGERTLTMPDPRVVEQTHTIAIPTPARGSAPIRAGDARPAESRRAAARRFVLPGAAVGVVAIASAVWMWQSRGADRPAGASTAASAAVVMPAAPERNSEPAATGVPPAPRATRDTAAVWQRLAGDDRDGVMTLLRDARSGGSPEDERLAQDVFAFELQRLVESRAAADAVPGAAATESYRLAERREAAARRQSATEPVAALALVWEARDSYGRAAIAGRASAGSPVTTETRDGGPVDPRTSASPGAPAAQPGPASPLPAAALASQPQPAPTPAATPSQPQPAIVTSPAPETAARAVPPPAAAAPTRPSAESVRTPTDAERINDVLARWRASYDRRDVASLLQIYPSLRAADVEMLRRSFRTNAYDVEMQQAPVQVNGNTASVRAVIAWRITPDVGGKTIEQRTTTDFHLRREGNGWIITSMSSR